MQKPSGSEMRKFTVVFLESNPESKKIRVALIESKKKKHKNLRHAKMAAFIRSLYRD